MRLVLFAIIAALAGCAVAQSTQPALDPRFQIGQVLFSDDFQHGTDQWVAELEKGGKIDAHDGKLEIDVPGGCSLWFKQEMTGPLLIKYDATVIKSNGPNDRVSDLNCFWMATDPRSPGDLLAIHRSGAFADYNQLLCYYVGLGGNTNTTTRFRRYIGSPTTRPLLPEHDLSGAKFLISPNVKQRITLVACNGLIQYYRDGQRLFEFNDPQPYTHGWFAFRTVTNHMVIENWRVMRITQR